jgi:hypothetical protein
MKKNDTININPFKSGNKEIACFRRNLYKIFIFNLVSL